jgi:hypothetical protein
MFNTAIKRTTILLVILIILLTVPGFSQDTSLEIDTTLTIPKLQFDANGNLKIDATSTSSQHDFDFLEGKWKMYNTHLNKRLENCKDWTEFVSYDECSNILDGAGNMDTYSTTEFPGLEGRSFKALTLRLFDSNTKLWSLYWVPKNSGKMDPPVVGSFKDGVGYFFCEDKFKDKPIIVMYCWDVRDADSPVWGQAFSTDKGKNWEWNFFNLSERIK